MISPEERHPLFGIMRYLKTPQRLSNVPAGITGLAPFKSPAVGRAASADVEAAGCAASFFAGAEAAGFGEGW